MNETTNETIRGKLICKDKYKDFNYAIYQADNVIYTRIEIPSPLVPYVRAFHVNCDGDASGFRYVVRSYEKPDKCDVLVDIARVDVLRFIDLIRERLAYGLVNEIKDRIHAMHSMNIEFKGFCEVKLALWDCANKIAYDKTNASIMLCDINEDADITLENE